MDYFVDKLFTQMVVLEIKIDKFNLPPTYVKRYTVTKYYGSDVNDLNKHRGSSSLSGSVPRLANSNVSLGLNYFDMVYYAIDYENLGTTITEDEEKLMDEIEWSWVSEIVPPTTHTVTNQPPHAPNTNMNDPVLMIPHMMRLMLLLFRLLLMIPYMMYLMQVMSLQLL